MRWGFFLLAMATFAVVDAGLLMSTVFVGLPIRPVFIAGWAVTMVLVVWFGRRLRRERQRARSNTS